MEVISWRASSNFYFCSATRNHWLALPAIFDNQLRDVNFPYDLRADAKRDWYLVASALLGPNT